MVPNHLQHMCYVSVWSLCVLSVIEIHYRTPLLLSSMIKNYKNIIAMLDEIVGIITAIVN